MICLLSYVGMNLQSEVCLWTLLGILRTILEATTLFKVNDKLKQVWQMSMPEEMSMPVQRAFRTMICGVLLVQCFTVYVYLASYVVLLYPIVLEERPTLVILWLLLAAIRNFLCELTSLALGMGACILLGPSKPSFLKFLISKVASIAPAFYMWMLVYTYYKSLKLAVAYKTFPAVVQGSSNHDYGLELAVRRRLTKSLQKEEQLRRNLTAYFQDESKHLLPAIPNNMQCKSDDSTEYQTNSNHNGTASHYEIEASERLISNVGVFEDWCGDEVTLPRDTDRILEQFVLMMLRIAAFIKSGNNDPRKLFNSVSPMNLPLERLGCSTVNSDDAEPPPSVGNSRPKTLHSYIQEYPQIFMKKTLESLHRIPERIISRNKFAVQSETIPEDNAVKTSLLDSIFESNTLAPKPSVSEKDGNASQNPNNNNCKKSKDISVATNSREIVLKEACTNTHNLNDLSIRSTSNVTNVQKSNNDNQNDEAKNS